MRCQPAAQEAEKPGSWCQHYSFSADRIAATPADRLCPVAQRARLLRTIGDVNCELRQAAASDEPFLREMLYLALFVLPGEPPLPWSVLSNPAIGQYVDGWGTRSGDSGLIALVNGVPVGAAWLRCFPASEPGYAFVNEGSVAVLAAHRAKGIGWRLMHQLLQGVDAASLSYDPANPAWRLYIRLGFKPLPDGRTMLRMKSPR